MLNKNQAKILEAEINNNQEGEIFVRLRNFPLITHSKTNSIDEALDELLEKVNISLEEHFIIEIKGTF